MSHQVVKVKREVVASCMTCPLCNKLFRDATTIIECLHTFCRKCIYKKLSDEEMECCPVCTIDLGCSPLEKLRADHNMQDVRAKIFPSKRIKMKSPEPEVVAPVTLPVKRKERSLSSLVVNTPKVTAQSGMTGRRSKSTARKASRGPNFTIEKSFKKEDDEDQLGNTSSPDTLNKYGQKQNSAVSEPSNHSGPNKRRVEDSNTWEGKGDPWKPLNCLVEAANRSKSSKFGGQGSAATTEPMYPNDDGVIVNKTKIKEQRKLKSKVQDEKNASDNAPSDSERPKKKRKVRAKKAHNFGNFMVPPQVVVDASRAKFDGRNHSIWFSLVAHEEPEAHGPPLPQISANYIRIKDGSIPVSFIQKYLKAKLDLTTEDEVEIKCMGQTVIPSLTLNTLVDLWLQTTTSERVTATIGSSAKDFVMVLGYARKSPVS